MLLFLIGVYKVYSEAKEKMKKYLIVLLFFIPFPLAAGIIGEIESGVILDDKNFYANMLAGYSWQYFEVYGGIDTFMKMNNPINYAPFHVAYIIGAKIKYKNLYLKFEHNCFHPIWSGNELMESTFYYDYGTIIGIGYKWGKE